MRRLLLAALAAIACALGPSEPNASTVAQDGSGRRVLFVGNSLTYVNDLPLVVRALSRASLGDSALDGATAPPRAPLARLAASP
jgi:hypothetical protein